MARTIIAGAGPAGTCLALLLARNGIDVLLLERQVDFAREFRGELLQPSGLTALEAMGLAEELDKIPKVVPERIELFTWGRKRFSLPIDPAAFDDHRPSWVSQPALLEMLVAQGAQHPSFTLRRGSTIRDLLFEGDRVVGVRYSDHDGEHEERADLVIGCDGRSSVIRQRSGIRPQETALPMDIIWCKLPMLPGLDSPPTARAYLGGHLLLCLPVYDGQLQMAWVIPKGSFGELKKRDITSWMEEAACHTGGDLADHLRAHRGKEVEPFLLSTRADHLPHWSRPGLLLIGDAAHTMSPVGGQGLNIAIRDALVAANHLVPALRENAPSGDALRAIEAERRPEVETIQHLQERPLPLVLGKGLIPRMLISVLPSLLPHLPVSVRSTPMLRTAFFGEREIELRV